MIYYIDVRETFVKTSKVEAGTMEKAKLIAKQMHKNKEPLSNYNDFSQELEIRCSDENFEALEDWENI